MKTIKYIVALSCLSIILSCEEQPLTIPKFIPPTTNKVVLVEEFTGASCSGCPTGAANIEQILEKYPDNVAAVAVHGKFLCEPIEDKSKYDFRNDDALNIELSFGLTQKPSASIDRNTFPDGNLNKTSPGVWPVIVEAILDAEEPKLALSIVAEETDGVIGVQVFGTALEDIVGNLNIGVYVTQSHILDYQKESGETIKDFEFNHFLRKSLTGVPNGDILLANLDQGDGFDRSYSYVIPTDLGPMEPEWKVEDLEIVAYVSIDGTGVAQVLQAAKAKL